MKTTDIRLDPEYIDILSNKDSVSIDDSEDERVEKTNWRVVYIAGAVSFLCAIEGAAVHMSEWPYMKEIDPDASVQFFGVAMSASKACHAIFVVVFVAWSFKFKTIKVPLIVGRVIASIACFLYLAVEFLPSGRRYLMMGCFFLFDISGSSPAILRAYVAANSTLHDRSRVFATLSLSGILSMILGPTIQLAFTKIPYPGYKIINHVYFNVFTAPVWIANCTNIISILIIFFGLKELPKKPKIEKTKEPSIFEWKGIKNRFARVKKSNINWWLAATLWTCKSLKTLTARSVGILLPALLMVQYGWSSLLTVRMTSILLAGSGVLSLFIIGCFMFCKLGTIISVRYIYLFANVVFLVFYVITYPYTSIGVEVSPYNATEADGCDPDKYIWCPGAIAPQPGLFLGALVFVLGVTVPSSMVSIDTMYSKLLGHIDQSLMQGIAVFIDDVVLIITPTYASYMYTLFGLKPLWLINGTLVFGVVILWIIMLHKFKNYS